ncbi:hypothetical protein O7627_35300 [Solwaraspora sp. WMMD1047]|uniref:hypothetical protein n=1 Tax=Solwaraspora sp. WMMD1047 TaxID=3016102 RepID=UPI002417151E|nr:hypothetical protein [Solwaraspora sp. WMMD1047]MDG4834537.1 hypothetical protein [Solwaraspora sp. WMMD1047]
MFGIGRRRSHRQLAKAELGEGIGHLRLAATHAAGGVGATVGPRVDAARRYVAPTATRVRSSAVDGWGATMSAVAPLAVAAADGARQAGSAAGKSRAGKATKARTKAAAKATRAAKNKATRRGRPARRWPAIAGLVAAGAAIGVAGAVVMRRRRQAEWDSYDPAPALDTLPSEAVPVLAHTSADPGRKPASGERTEVIPATATTTAPKASSAATPAASATTGTAATSTAAGTKPTAAAKSPAEVKSPAGTKSASATPAATSAGKSSSTPNGRA